MELKSAVCPNCGGRLELNPDLEKGICVYCGSEIIVADAIRKFKGEIDGIATVKKSLMRAEQLMEDGDADGAMKVYRHVIESDPHNAEAFFGMYICETVVAEYYSKLNAGMERCWLDYYNSISEAEEKYAKRAIQYADSAHKEIYSKLINERHSDAERRIHELDEHSKNSGCLGGCYIATAVYGSYQAPEVLILRKYRDEVLSNSLVGRAFIKSYYFLSPPVAKWLKNAGAINRIVRIYLDKFVGQLEERR